MFQLVDSLEGITATAALEELARGKEQLPANLRTNESLLLDKGTHLCLV